jgi:4-hydroxy-4-methyl-2-oxoglutarate aldolase
VHVDKPTDEASTYDGMVFCDLPRPPLELTSAFQTAGVADVHEALPVDTLMDNAIRALWPGCHAAGPALTVLNRQGDTLMLHRAISLARAGDVLVVTADGPTPSAMWGNLMTTAAVGRGVAGAVIDGPARDVAEVRSAGFALWSRSISPRGSKRLGPGAVNVPVMCGGVRVCPGDLIVADDDGIVVVPRALLQVALAGAQARMAKEAAALPKIAAGSTPYELWGMAEALRASGVTELPGCWGE